MGKIEELKKRRAFEAKLRKIRSEMPRQTSEEAYAGLEKRRAMDAAEKAKNKPVDTIYITP